MVKHGSSWDDFAAGKRHAAKVVKKQQRIAGLKDLLAMWEKYEVEHGNREADHKYVLHLRAQLRNAENQKQAMAG